MNVKERIKKFIEHKNLPVCKFEDECGLSNGYIAAMRKGFGEEKLNNVLKAFPDLNREWLLYGEGDMIKIPATMTIYNPTPEEENPEGVNVSVFPAPAIEEAKAEAIEEYKAEESIVMVPVEIANAPQKDIKEYIESKGDELESILPSDLVKPANGAERVRKNSMSPTFNPSDIVFFKLLDDVRNITDGNIYYFKIKNRPTMLRRVKIEGEKLRLIAENPNFGDIIITFSNIINVADIVGMFRSSFGNQYAEIEAVRRKKDSQIDKLIKQNSDALKSISDLISVIKNK